MIRGKSRKEIVVNGKKACVKAGLVDEQTVAFTKS